MTERRSERKFGNVTVLLEKQGGRQYLLLIPNEFGLLEDQASRA